MQDLLLTLLLSCLTMIGPLAIDGYLPCFPAIAHTFAASPILVQQTLSAYLFTFALMMLFYGTLSDSFGRRPVILFSLGLYSVASIGAAFAPSIGWLIALRAVQGLSAGAGSVVGRAIVRDRFAGHKAQQVMAHITMVFGIAPAIAPILGGWLQANYGWRYVFYSLTGVGALMLAACFCCLPESLPRTQRQAFHLRSIAGNYWRALRHPQFLFLVLGIGLAFSGFALYIGSAANFIIHILHLSETSFAWLFFPLVGGMVAGSAVAARIAARVQSRRLIRHGYTLMIIAVLGNVGYNYFYAAAVPWAVLPLFLYSFGLSVAMPSMTIIALDVFPQMRGTAASLQGFLQMMLFALVAGLVTPLLFASAYKLACGHAAGLALSLIFWAAGSRRPPRPPRAGDAPEPGRAQT